MNKSIIGFALSRLNNTNNGSKKFEILCQNLIPTVVDHGFLPSSGQDSGGDGGIDGWSLLGESGKIKYAFSIDLKARQKLKAEIKKTSTDQYQEIRFFTNQPISEKTKSLFYDSTSIITTLIYDMDNIIELIDSNEYLGKFIDLPLVQKSIDIDYLKKHNQLLRDKDIILHYIPRTIRFYDKRQKEWISVSLSEYCSDLPFITILQAPAGYGKTSILQQLHQKILENDIDTDLPPVFISLSSYIPATLLEMIKDRMMKGDDYRINDFLLLLDGYDELKDSDRESLIKELGQLFENTALIRKAIISVRENTYNYSDFEVFEDIRLSSLCKLTNDDIRLLLINESINVEDATKFFNNSFFQEFSDNIFYVVRFIEYFEVNHTIAGSVIDLFTFIINQEVSRIFRKDKPDESNLESLDLFMTINQINEIFDIDYLFKLKINTKMNPFRFSHKSIQEFLAAKKIVKQPLERIKMILAKGNSLIPFLTNTLGFVLNILNETDKGQDAFVAFVSWSLEGVGNAKRLLLIEADKISPDMNRKIFTTVTEQEAQIGSFFNQPLSLVSFGLKEQSRKKNLDYILTNIEALKDTNDYHYYTSVLQSVTYHHIDEFAESYQERLLDFLVVLLNPRNIYGNQKFIESLLFSVAYFPALKRLDNSKLYFIVKQLLSLINSGNIVDNLCQLLLMSEMKYDQNIYFRIYDYILNYLLSERGQMGHFVSTQTADDTYHEPLSFTFWHSFIPLTEKILIGNPSFVWELMKYTISNQEKVFDSHNSTSELSDLFQVFFNVLKSELEPKITDEYKRRIIIDWIICDIKAYLDSMLWIYLSENLDFIFINGIAKEIIHETGKLHSNQDILNYYINIGIISTHSFDRFKEEFLINEDGSLRYFFEKFCFCIKEDHPIYSYIQSNIPIELKESIEKSKLLQKENITQTEKKKIAPLSDYHIAFKNEELRKEVEEIFECLGSDMVTNSDFWNHYHKKLLRERNDFAIFIFQSSYWGEEKKISKKDMMINLENDNWLSSFMSYLIQYCIRHKIDIDNFTVDEKQKTISWVKSVLNTCPLDTIDSSFKGIHIILSNVLRISNFLDSDDEIGLIYKEKMIGLIFSGFPKFSEGPTSVGYDAFSIDYLDRYLYSKDVLDIITNSFNLAFPNQYKMISVCGYIAGHIQVALPYQTRIMKNKITEYIEKHLKDNFYPTIIDCAFSLGFSISDLNIDLLANAFFIDENGQDLAHNYALCFINYQSHENTETEVQHLLKALYKSFMNSKDPFQKKTIAEYYIKYNPMGGEVFEFYAEYLMENDNHTILHQYVHNGSNTPLKTTDIKQIEIVNRLFRYSRAKKTKSERRDGILSIALSSYKAMADISNEREKLDLILSAMRSLADEGHRFLYRQMQEIEIDFIERTYKPLSFDEIGCLE